VSSCNGYSTCATRSALPRVDGEDECLSGLSSA
jgi:hypothetical protein